MENHALNISLCSIHFITKHQFLLMRHLYFLVFIILLFPVFVSAQQETEKDTLSGDPAKLEQVIVYANKFPEQSKYVAQNVTLIKNKTALNLQPNTADVLINSGALFVQKSQQGGGSPQRADHEERQDGVDHLRGDVHEKADESEHPDAAGQVLGQHPSTSV